MATTPPEIQRDPESKSNATWASDYAWGWVFVAAIVLALAAWAVFRATSTTPPLPAPAPVEAPVQGEVESGEDAVRARSQPIDRPSATP